MKEAVKELKKVKKFRYRKATRYTLKEGKIVARTEAYKGPGEVTDAAIELIDKAVTIDALLSEPKIQAIPKPLKIFKGLLNILKLEDDATQFLNLNSKVQYANNINSVLKEENDELRGKDEIDLRFFENYDNTKAELKENARLYEEQKKIVEEAKQKINELRNNNGANIENEIKKQENIIKDAKNKKHDLEQERAYIENMRERAVVKEVIDLNKENRYFMGNRILGNIAGFVASVIEIVALPVNKIVVAGLQIPTLFDKLVSKVDEHVLKKFREKAENSRKENLLNNQLEVIKEKVGEVKYTKIVGEEVDKNKQKELLEKSEDEIVKAAIKASKKTQKVLCSKPCWYYRVFRPYVLEDEEKMRNISSSIFKMIKDLPDFEEAKKQLDELNGAKKEKIENGLKEAEASKIRIKGILDLIGIDNSEDFIKSVKDYQNKKKSDLERVNWDKSKMSAIDKDGYSARKNELKNKLVDAMKQRI